MIERELFKIAPLAHNRYPSDDIDFAIMKFLSDRRAAGLGALGSREFSGSCIKNTKTIVEFGKRIQYRSTVNIPERLEFPKFIPVPCVDAVASMCIQLTQIPARKDDKAVRFELDDFDTQSGRKYVACVLRKMRRDMRKVTKETPCTPQNS